MDTASHPTTGATQGAQPPVSTSPESYCYHLKNAKSLSDGSLQAVLSTHVKRGEFNAVVGHYLSYINSLVADELTSPYYTLTNRLHWCEKAELHHMEGPLQIDCLAIHVGEFVVFSFRGRQTWRETLKTVGTAKVSLDRRIPQRIAIAEEQRRASKSNSTAPITLPTTFSANPTYEEEDLFAPGPKGVLVNNQLSGPYQLLGATLRSFAIECVGRPIPIKDMVRAATVRPKDSTAPVVPERAKPCIIVTGHGMGGSMAQLCAMDMSALFGPSAVACYTFGAPRLGNNKFAKLWATYGGDLFRVVNATDPLPGMPGQLSGFFHPSDTRVEFSYPPRLGLEGYQSGQIPKRSALTRPVHRISRSAHKAMHSENADLRIHTCYMGIQIAQKLDAIEPFNFVVRRLIDVEPPQAPAEADDPPIRAELNLSLTAPPWDLFLSNLDAAERPTMKRRLQAFSGSRQTPYVHSFTPAVQTGESLHDEGDGGRHMEPVDPDRTAKTIAQPEAQRVGSGIGAR